MPCIARGQDMVPGAIKREKIPLPEMGKDPQGQDFYLWIRCLTSPEIVAVREQNIIAETPEQADPDGGFKLIALCAVDDEGTRIFNDADDVKANLKVQSSSIVAMVEKITALAGVNKKN